MYLYDRHTVTEGTATITLLTYAYHKIYLKLLMDLCGHKTYNAHWPWSSKSSVFASRSKAGTSS